MAASLFGRRLFAKATMGVPLALGSTVSVSAHSRVRGLSGPPVADGLGANAQSSDPAQTTHNRVWEALRSVTRSRDERSEEKWTVRAAMGGLDPDLAVLNSMSVVRRIRIQLDRDIAEVERLRSWRNKIIFAMGGDPKDFDR